MALCLGRDFVAVDRGREIGPFESVRELCRLFMVGATRKVSFVDRFIRGFGRGFLGIIFVVFLHGLIPFFFDRFGIRLVEKVGDGRLHAAKIRWVGASVDGFLEFV